MYIQSEYLGDKIDFDTFEECCKYYQKDAVDIFDLQEELKEEQCGMAYPILTQKEKYEVERITVDGRKYNKYFDEYKDALKFFEEEIELQKDKSNKDCDDFEEYESLALYEWNPGDDSNFEEAKALCEAFNLNNFKITKY